jgi:hypothetical protein
VEQLLGPTAIAQLDDLLVNMRNSFSKFLKDNPDFFDNLRQFLEEFKDLPEKQRKLWSEAARLGWYLNGETSITVKSMVLKGQTELDSYMIESLRADWPMLTKSILSAHPERGPILECAFQLHTEGRYIASVPLFLAQADGICAQIIGAHLFTDSKQREAKLAEMSVNSDAFMVTLLGLLGLKTQFVAGIRSASPMKKSLAPNRNGILHGARKHLDYGTEINSFKAFSLLAFVVYILSEIPAASGA